MPQIEFKSHEADQIHLSATFVQIHLSTIEIHLSPIMNTGQFEIERRRRITNEIERRRIKFGRRRSKKQKKTDSRSSV